MKVSFKFPILHECCDTCEARFNCMTRKIHHEYDITHGGSSEVIVLPFKFHLQCFRLEPYKNVKTLELNMLPDGVSMVLDFCVS